MVAGFESVETGNSVVMPHIKNLNGMS